MSTVIKDGKGGGKFAEVDSTNKLATRSITTEEWKEALELGDHYGITSGQVTLTSACTSAVLFFTNNEDQTLIVDRLLINSDDSCGGSVDNLIVGFTKNGTSISCGSGNDPIQVNTNFGSSNTLCITGERGAEGATICGGSNFGALRIENPTRHRGVDVRFLIPKGSSLGIRITPPAGNTSMVVVFSINVHKLKDA